METTNAISKAKAGASAIDFHAEKPDTRIMADTITRPELDAKLELIEARADARMSRFEERIDQAIAEMRRDSDRVYSAITNLKTTTIVTGVTAAIAIVFGVAAFNATLLSNMTASFESGKATASSIVQASENLKQTQDDLRAIRERLDQHKQPQK